MTKPIESETGTAPAAVIYLRVSTPDQLNTAIDIDPDGNSIATQRDFCHRRATGLDAAVQKEFVEPGTSAQSIDKRPVFKQLLAYLDEHTEITHVIVYMRSRAFRNYTDAAVTKRRLAEKGVKLLSAKEDFGEGYIADAMEGIIDIFNELESRRNGEDIKAKLRNKALNGGTVSRAKLGYLNTRAEQDGRLFNTITVDEQRSELVKKAFELYATGHFAIARLEATMADLGLTTRASARWPEQPVSGSKLHRMLSDPYYAGWVSVDGRLVQGRQQRSSAKICSTASRRCSPLAQAEDHVTAFTGTTSKACCSVLDATQTAGSADCSTRKLAVGTVSDTPTTYVDHAKTATATCHTCRSCRSRMRSSVTTTP